jgi:hypothetical protein
VFHHCRAGKHGCVLLTPVFAKLEKIFDEKVYRFIFDEATSVFVSTFKGAIAASVSTPTR